MITLRMTEEEYKFLTILMISGRHALKGRLEFDIAHEFNEHAKLMHQVIAFGENYHTKIERTA